MPKTSANHYCSWWTSEHLLKTMEYMKYFIICIFTGIPLLCVMLCRGMEYQVGISSDQLSLQDNLSCLSISIHCVWTPLGELHLELEAYMYAVFFNANDDVLLIESRFWICREKERPVSLKQEEAKDFHRLKLQKIEYWRKGDRIRRKTEVEHGETEVM